MSSIHIPPGEGQTYPMIDVDHVAKVAVHDTNGALEVFEVISPAAPMAPPHVSPWTGVLFLLEGQATPQVGDTKYEVEPGGVVMMFPAGTPSSFEVVNSVPSDQPVEESMEAILSIIQCHGVRLAGA